MILTNIEMANRINILSKPVYINRKDIIGYAAARNIRILRNSCVEYLDKQNELITRYGSEELDSNGNPTGRFGINVNPNDEAFKSFKRDIEEFAIIEHTVTIFKIPYERVCGELTGSEILDIDWMLEDSDKPADD